MAVAERTSDMELLQSIAAGDRDAFLELYDRYSPRLMGVISGIIRDRHGAEDVLQGVMLEVWRQYAARYDPALGSVESWMFRLARSRAIDATRAFHRKRMTTSESTDHAVDSARQHHDSLPTEFTRDPALASALLRLPDEVRAPILMAYTRGMTREAIAESLGEPVGTIKTRIRRGLARLHELMTDASAGDPLSGRASKGGRA